MGASNSKTEGCEALRLCKERKKFIKQAIDSRYSLAAAHVAYVEALNNIGIALCKFAEVEVSIQPSSATDGEKTPSHSSQPSPPSQPQTGCGGGGDSHSRLSYMKSGGTGAVTVSLHPSKISSSNKVYVDVGSSPFTMPPPPPPPPWSWDYFHPSDDSESFRIIAHDDEFQVSFNDKHADFNGRLVMPPESVKTGENGHGGDDLVATQLLAVDSEGNGALTSKNARMEQCHSKDSSLTDGETEDHSEFITNRAKDFVSSIKDIESNFLSASRSGNKVLQMLEANKIQVSYSKAKGSATTSTLSLVNCCKRKDALVSHEPRHVITWKRSTSSHSSLSPNPLATPSNNDNGSRFVEEFCMIAGSHSSTLDRLYAWERKLYDEVEASEAIRKEYDRKCDQLRHQFAKDVKAHVIDKNRAMAKDLHSRSRVALHTVSSISKQIEKMRDDELQPQLVELIQGLIGMWKVMLECHHAQYITISLAYHSKASRTQTQHDETKSRITTELEHEIERFGLTFTDLVKCYTSYVESINSWLQNCITKPKERVKGKRAFSPLRAMAPSIFVTCRDWSAGLQTLPSQKLDDAIKDLSSCLHRVSIEDLKKKRATAMENGDDMKNDNVMASSMVHSSLVKVLDHLTKFSEASLTMYEDVKQKSDAARNAYLNYRPPPRAFSI